MANLLKVEATQPVNSNPPLGIWYEGVVFAVWLSACVLQRLMIPRFFTPKRLSESDAWKWRRALHFMFNSAVMGIGGLWCVYDKPELITDPITVRTVGARTVIAISAAYYVWDTLDLLLYRNSHAKRFFIRYSTHHIAVLTCGVTFILGEFGAGFCIGSNLPIHNIFFCITVLLRCLGWKETDTIYRVNNWLMLCASAVFRVTPLCYWVPLTIMRQATHFPLAMTISACGTLVALFSENLQLLIDNILTIIRTRRLDVSWADW